MKTETPAATVVTVIEMIATTTGAEMTAAENTAGEATGTETNAVMPVKVAHVVAHAAVAEVAQREVVTVQHEGVMETEIAATVEEVPVMTAGVNPGMNAAEHAGAAEATVVAASVSSLTQNACSTHSARCVLSMMTPRFQMTFNRQICQLLPGMS